MAQNVVHIVIQSVSVENVCEQDVMALLAQSSSLINVGFVVETTPVAQKLWEHLIKRGKNIIIAMILQVGLLVAIVTACFL